MHKSLIDQFLEEDFNESNNNQLFKDCNDLITQDIQREYTFNRFNLKINFGNNEVILDDDLNMENDGQVTFDLNEFIKLIKKNK